jgi:hypothetical protein
MKMQPMALHWRAAIPFKHQEALMRVLSKEERGDLYPTRDFPIDMRESFLPIQILISDEPKSLENRLRIDPEKMKRVLVQAEDSLGLEPLVTKGLGRKEWLYPKAIELSHYSFPESFSTNMVYPTYGLLSLDRFLTRKELSEIKITPLPGYLYLAASVSFRYDESQAVLLREPNLRDMIEKLRLRKEVDRTYLECVQEILPEKKDPVWLGPLGDIERCINARCVHSFPPTEGGAYYGFPIYRTHILATPFELPPGFVIDTVSKLNELKDRIPRVAKKFRECVLNPREAPADYAPPYDFPQGPPKLNDDRRWIFSEKPWFVQHVLFSRIIGGNYWRTNLQKFELTGYDPE